LLRFGHADLLDNIKRRGRNLNRLRIGVADVSDARMAIRER